MSEHVPARAAINLNKLKHHDQLTDRLTTDPLNDSNVTIPERYQEKMLEIDVATAV